MKVKFKYKGKPIEIKFNAGVEGGGAGFALRPASSKDNTLLRDLIADSDGEVIRGAILKHVEKKLGVPVQLNYDYQGSGWGLKIDMHSLIGKL